MRRKRLVAKLMALSLMFSGLPMTPAYAAELPEQMEAVEGAAETEEDSDKSAEGDLVKEADGTEPIETDDSAMQDQEAPVGDADADQKAPAEDADADQKAPAEDADTDQETSDGSLDVNEAQPEDSDTEKAADEAEQISQNSTEARSGKIRISETAKMAGSNGVLYDGVTYLSARNVMAMDEEMQKAYRAFCDEIAASKEGGLELENVVLAVDSKGDLYCSYYVPMRALDEIQAEMLPGANEPLTADVETDAVKTAEEKKDEETSDESQNTGEGEEEKKDDGTSDENQNTGDGEEEKKDEETSDENQNTGDGEEEKKDEETSDENQNSGEGEEEKKDDETLDENQDTGDGEEEKKDDEALDEDQNTGDGEEEKKDDETSDENQNTGEEEKKEDEVSDEEKVNEGEIPEEEAEEEYVLFEENVDKLPDMEEETFEVPESVRVENTIDLGYGEGTGDGLSRSGKEFRSVLPTDDYFVKQLSAKQKQYYDIAESKLTKGSNKISFKDSLSEKGNVGDNIAHAISALILAYPDKTDWIAKPGGFNGVCKYKIGSSVAEYTFTFDKSKFYSGSLDSKAKTQVQAIGNQAQQYVAEKYPKAPVYGFVKYFDNWICENGYYEMLGTVSLAPYSAEAIRVLKGQGFSSGEIEALYKIYYNCHSAYGMLLEGYGVCESYAKSMSRLLDAVGIPNIYVVGMAGDPGNQGGHAWNYVQMPDGNWYLLDSTWNDTTEESHNYSTGDYLLVKEDGKHKESGCNYNGEKPDFTFPGRAGSDYDPGSATDSVTLNKTECSLQPKGKETLTYQINGSDEFGRMTGVWASSNSKVAKVDQKGVITAVAAGEAKITYSVPGMAAECAVKVDQVKAVKVKDTKKTSENVSLGIDSANKGGGRDIVLDVDMGASPHTAEWMIKEKKEKDPTVTLSEQGIANVTVPQELIKDNEITVHVEAIKEGSISAKVLFAGKTVTIKVSVGKLITKEMFEDVVWPEGMTGADGSKTIAYTGKAVKPVIKKKTDTEYKPVTFKTVYINNKDAGNAKVVVTGTGKYGGVIEYPFTITPLELNSTNTVFPQTLKSKVYNGGANPPTMSVKFNKKTLKANKDYKILYTGNGVTKEELNVVPAGKYKITIEGIGNYEGVVETGKDYEVTVNTIVKVTAAGSGSAKYTGVASNPFTVKIGKNILPETDYKITWYQGQGKTQSTQPMKESVLPVAKGKYTAVITVRGKNLTTTDRKKEIKKNFTIK